MGWRTDEIANETMWVDEATQEVFVYRFQVSDWVIMQTPARGPRGTRRLFSMCGVWALLNSLKEQYPNDAAVRGLTFNRVKQAVDAASAPNLIRYRNEYSSDQLYLAAEALGREEALGTYMLVQAFQFAENDPMVAVRLSSQDPQKKGRNLYINHRFKGAHWQAMRRKRAGE
jgi:hypothetical protein